jgi:hypothetical protein
MRELRNTSLKECIDEIFLFFGLDCNDNEGWSDIFEEWEDEKNLGMNRKYEVEEKSPKKIWSWRSDSKSESEILREVLIQRTKRKILISNLPYRQRYVMRLVYRIVNEKDGSELEYVDAEDDVRSDMMNNLKRGNIEGGKGKNDQLDFVNVAHQVFFRIKTAPSIMFAIIYYFVYLPCVF